MHTSLMILLVVTSVLEVCHETGNRLNLYHLPKCNKYSFQFSKHFECIFKLTQLSFPLFFYL